MDTVDPDSPGGPSALTAERSELPRTRVTAVVCTRNRGDAVVDTVESIFASDCDDYDVVVVDQSTNELTALALQCFGSDSRLTLVRSHATGLGRARNTGLAAARSDICCFTDDDCTVRPDWLRVMTAVFDSDSQIAVAFCNVEPGPYDPSLGFVPVYHRSSDQVFRGAGAKRKARGIGAGLAVRKSAVERLGGFDEMLGAGAEFPSCEDGDIAARALLQGYAVYESAGTAVVHHGFRTWEQGRELSQRDWLGIGAAYVKPLKCGRWRFAPVVLHEVWTWAILPPLNDVVRLRRPAGLSRMIYLLRGAWRGLLTPVDRQTLRFVQKPVK